MEVILKEDIVNLGKIGEVVRVEKDGMGVVFVELAAYSKDLIDKLLTHRR